jgi:hypothetical protein
MCLLHAVELGVEPGVLWPIVVLDGCTALPQGFDEVSVFVSEVDIRHMDAANLLEAEGRYLVCQLLLESLLQVLLQNMTLKKLKKTYAHIPEIPIVKFSHRNK